MKSLLQHPLVLWACRLTLAGVFLVAAWYKITDLEAFALSISHYDMIPRPLLPLFTVLLAGVEVSAGLTLLTGLWRRGTAVVTGGMLVMFIIALATAYIRGLSIECGCFTADLSAEKASELRSQMLTRIVQDLGLLALALNIFVNEPSESVD